MGAPSVFIIKALLLLWIVCVVFCEHHKRDVHRIVIKQRVPRSQKKGHNNHGHDHKRGHRHSSRSKGHAKKPKTHVGSYENDSPENGSYNRENSFEDFLQKHKSHKSYHSDPKKSYTPPLYHANQEYEEPQQIYKEPKFIFQNEWTPLSSEQILLTSHESYKERHKKKRDGRKTYITSLKPPPVELTTSFPLLFEPSSVFPPVIGYPSAFSNFNLNHKIIESNQSPLIGTIEDPNVHFPELKGDYNRLKNHRTSYEVTELTPSDSNTNTIISVPDLSISEESVEEVTTKRNRYKKEEGKSTQRPTRNRGRVTFRGQSKA